MSRLAHVAAAALVAMTVLACGGGNGKVPAKAASDASASSDAAAPSDSESPSGSDAKGDPSEPCSLLSRSEAEKAIGSKLKEAPTEETDPRVDGTHGCRYSTEDASRTFAIEVFDTTSSGESAVKRTQSDGTTLEDVGDKAAYDKDFHRVFVVSGDVAFAVVFIIGDLDDEQQAGTKIADAVIANL